MLHVCTLGRALEQGRISPRPPPPATQPSSLIKSSSSIPLMSFMAEFRFNLLSKILHNFRPAGSKQMLEETNCDDTITAGGMLGSFPGSNFLH